MNDHRITEWRALAESPPLVHLSSLIEDLEIEGICGVASVFFENIARALELPELIPAIFVGGQLFQLAETHAMMEKTGKPFPETPGVIPSDVEALRDQKAFEYDNRGLHVLFKAMGSDSAYRDCARQRFDDKIQMLMSMQVVSVWTALETLIADLWETSLNIHPRLAELRGVKKVTVPLFRIKDHGFNLHGKMGAVLRANFIFSSLQGAREAYQAAFHDQGTGVKKAMASKAFDAVSVLRHVIVHRAGKCDSEYEKNSKGLPIPQLKPDELLELNGELLLNVTTPALHAALHLIRAVNGWFAGHEKSEEDAPDRPS
jgi:hypothetical protein